ncbi:MAG: hypothetical protein ABEJ94_01170 [Halorientalis sp.]
MTDPLTTFERRLLTEIAGESRSPASLAVALDTDLGTVLETTAALQARDLVERRRYDTCRLTARGRDHLAERPT